MPELPDLTVFAENLTKRLKGKTVKSVELYPTRNCRGTIEELEEALRGNSVEEVNRVGKETEFVFSKGTKIHVHLMLSGRFEIVKNAQSIKSKILVIEFEDGDILVVHDYQGMATVKLNPEENFVPDALDVTEDYVKERMFKKFKNDVKTFLTDPKVIRGIGNAYADEILWHARISPKSLVGKIPEEVIDVLVNSIKVVLLDAVTEIKKADPEIIAGEIRDFLKVHNHSKKLSPTGHKIIKELINKRPTYYTEEQILYV
ncbi:MAG: DNA-formamidopyrimidine glycosylase family protein [Melioribacteraceae bacterium]